MAASAVAYIGTAAVGAYAASQQRAPQMPGLAAPPPPPQQAKAPDIAGIVQGLKGTGQGGPGNGQTFLTGAGGVDPNALKLNKPTLLGE